MWALQPHHMPEMKTQTTIKPFHDIWQGQDNKIFAKLDLTVILHLTVTNSLGIIDLMLTN